MKLASFFSGCGGLDLGFNEAGFDVIWANEYDKSIHETFQLNHPQTILNGNDIRNLKPEDVPECDGFIGGPPCQSWSVSGSRRGFEDDRGKLFLDYIRMVECKKPKFFLIENVAGILEERHRSAFELFIGRLDSAGYDVKYSLLNAADYDVPQDRYRVFIIGTRKDLRINFKFPHPQRQHHNTLKSAIGDIVDLPMFSDGAIEPILSEHGLWNHDVYTGPYGDHYVHGNRVRAWDEVSYTIQAQAGSIPQHPRAPKMHRNDRGEYEFKKGYECLYRRLSVRECARIQTFPDSFRLVYHDVRDGYKMVGNAVPPRLAYFIAEQIMRAFGEKQEVVAPRVHKVDIPRIANSYPLSIVENYYSRSKHMLKSIAESDEEKRVLICYVKDTLAGEFLSHSAQKYYTGRMFPSIIALEQLHYFMPYIKGKGVKDLYLIKSARVGLKKEVVAESDERESRLIFDLEFVKEMFPEYMPVHLNIWHTFTDTTLDNLMSINEDSDG